MDAGSVSGMTGNNTIIANICIASKTGQFRSRLSKQKFYGLLAVFYRDTCDSKSTLVFLIQ